MPQILRIEAGSLAALGCPRTQAGSTQQRCHCRASQVTHICPTSPHNSPHKPPLGLLLSEIAGKKDIVWSPARPHNWPLLTCSSGGEYMPSALTGSPNSSSVPACLTMAFMAGYRISALESPRHGYFRHSLTKSLCLHSLTLDLNFPFSFSSPAPVPNSCRI